MLRGFRMAAVAVSLSGLAGLAGCSEAKYPTLPSLGGIGGSLLSPQEQQKAINDLKTEQETHGGAAAKEIEGRS